MGNYTGTQNFICSSLIRFTNLWIFLSNRYFQNRFCLVETFTYQYPNRISIFIEGIILLIVIEEVRQ